MIVIYHTFDRKLICAKLVLYLLMKSWF